MQDISSKINQKRSYARSSSFVMALLFTVLCGGVAITLGYFINYFAQGHFVHSTRNLLDAEKRYIETQQVMPEAFSIPGRIYIPMNNKNTLPESLPEPSQEFSEGIFIFDLNQDNQTARYAAKIFTLDDGRNVLIGSDITAMSRDFDFMQLIGIGSIIFVMIVVFISYMISVFVVNGTNQITQTAQDIIRTGDLSRRIDMDTRWDDLGNVAGVLNLLLNRIEELMTGVKQVSDSIAHDLRTPLTRMRGHIETLQKEDKINHEYTALLNEIDHILNTFNALLRISRIETEKQRSHFKDVQLDKIISDVVSFYEPVAEDNDLALSMDLMDFQTHGDKDLLFQVYANILDNAIKFTPKGGNISISMLKENKNMRIEITNSGAAVDEQDLPKIFDRFYRVDKSRTTAGSGLGLSLVSAAIHLHDGHVYAQNSNDGFQIITIL